MNERGITLQTTIITSVLALAAAAAGIVIYNAISEESSSISENAAAADLDLFSYEYYGNRISLKDEVETFETPHLYGSHISDLGRQYPPICAVIGERDPADGIYKIAKIKKAASGSVVDVYSELRCGYIHTPPLPIAIDSTVGIKYVSSGPDRVCIITAADALECWGENSLGQLGRGEGSIQSYYNAANRRSVDLGGEIPVAVSTNQHNTCAVTASDKVFCWGSNEFSQLGNEYVASPENSCTIEVSGVPKEIECSTTPVEISELSGQGIKQLETGRDYNCALTNEGKVLCWGRNIDLELGVPSTEVLEDTPTPIEVPELTGVTELSEAHSHTCALIGEPGFGATLKCWGSNDQRELGRSNAYRSKMEPPIIPEIPDIESLGVKKVATYINIVCIITASDVIRCTNSNARDPDEFSGFPSSRNMSIASLELLTGRTNFCVVYLNNKISCYSFTAGEIGELQLQPDSPFRN